MTKEKIYDEKIAPLMSQIIAICKEHKIANICTFSIPDEDDNGLQCTTAMLTDEYDPPETLKEAIDIIRPPQRSPMMMTVRDGDGSVKEMHAIL